MNEETKETEVEKDELSEKLKKEVDGKIEKEREPSLIDKTIKKMGYDFDFDEEYEAPGEMPKVRIWRYVTVKLALKAERDARITFGIDPDNDPNTLQTLSAKLALVAKFHGGAINADGTLNAEEIGELPESFLYCIAGKFTKVLT